VVAVSLKTDLDIAAAGAPRETIIYPTWDLEEVFRAGLAGRATTTTVTIPTVTEPYLAPPNRHQVVVATMAPARHTDFDAAQIQSNMIHAAEEVVPGLRDHIAFALGTDGASALPLHQIGPIYGWSLTPGNSGPSRLPQITPIGGLYLAGHWTQPGYSIWGVIASGLRAARLMLQRHLTDGLQLGIDN
jgi:prolycopene isomerase